MSRCKGTQKPITSPGSLLHGRVVTYPLDRQGFAGPAVEMKMSRYAKQPNGLPIDCYRKMAKSGNSKAYIDSLTSRLYVGAPDFDFQGFVMRQVLAALEDEQNNVFVELMPTRCGDVYVFVRGKDWPLPPDGRIGLMIHKELRLRDMIAGALESTGRWDDYRSVLLADLERCVALVKNAMAEDKEVSTGNSEHIGQRGAIE